MWELENWTAREYEKFVLYLQGMEDLEYRKFHSKLLPGIERLIGIRTPKMREIAKQIVKGDYKGFLAQSNKQYKNGHSYYEQIIIEGMVIGYISNKKTKKLNEIKVYISDFAPKINNWAICDSFCSGLKIIDKYPAEFWDFIIQYVEEAEEFKVRMGIVLLMNYYLKEEYIDFVLLKCNQVKRDDYYVNMAIAWLISVAFVNFEDKTLEYLKHNQLSKFTYNKAIQKITESNRVSKEQKDLIRSMKR